MTLEELGRIAAKDALERGYWVLWATKRDAKRPGHAYSKGNPGALEPLREPSDLDGGGMWQGKIVRWERGVCILLREGQYVMDGDTPEGAALVREVGADTLRVATERGVHAYFTLPIGVRLRQGAGVVAAGVDGKGLARTGNYTVASWWTPEGSKRIEHDVPAAPLPEEWVSRLRDTSVVRESYIAPPMLTDPVALKLGDEALQNACEDLRAAFRRDPDGAWARKAWGAGREMADWLRVGYPFVKAHDALHDVFVAEQTYDERPGRVSEAIEAGLRS